MSNSGGYVGRANGHYPVPLYWKTGSIEQFHRRQHSLRCILQVASKAGNANLTAGASSFEQLVHS